MFFKGIEREVYGSGKKGRDRGKFMAALFPLRGENKGFFNTEYGRRGILCSDGPGFLIFRGFFNFRGFRGNAKEREPRKRRERERSF